LKPWWRVSAGEKWFSNDDSVILGCDAAEIELRSPGELFFSPENRPEVPRLPACSKRSGTSDDSLFSFRSARPNRCSPV